MPSRTYTSYKLQLQIRCLELRGDEAKASQLMRQIVEFGIKTPFKTADLIEYTQRLLAMGFKAEEVIPTLKAVGDAVAGLGGGAEMVGRVTLALGQMKEKGKVSGEEIRQLAEAGIPAWEFLAKAAGKSIAEVQVLAQKGMLNADRAVFEIIKGHLLGAALDARRHHAAESRKDFQAAV
jgi:tape measure domain-containing protein